MVKQSRNMRNISKNDILEALKKANIPEDEYSIDGYCESCLCIENTANGWEVYHGERGVKHNISTYTSLDALIASVCDRLGYAKPVTKVQQRSQIRKHQNSSSISFHPRPIAAVVMSSSPMRKVALKKATYSIQKKRPEVLIGDIEVVFSSRQMKKGTITAKHLTKMSRIAKKAKMSKLRKYKIKLGK